jgi:hypothetical protein
MCLAWTPIDADAMHRTALTALMHETVSCAGAYTFCAYLDDGTVATVNCIPVRGTGVRFVAFPIAPEHAAALRPCGTAPCLASHVRAWTDPGSLVEEPQAWDDDDVYGRPVYRSLGDEDSASLAVKVLSYPNGRSLAIVEVATFVPTHDDGMTIEARTSLLDKMRLALTRELDAHGITLARLFGTDMDKETAEWELVHHLASGIAPKCHVALGILADEMDPPTVATEATFTFLTVHGETGAVLLPGLCHGNALDVDEVEEDVYVITNHPSHEYVLPKAHADEQDVVVRPQPLEAYVTNGSHSTYSEAQRALQHSTAEDARVLFNGFLTEHALPPLAPGTALRVCNLKGYALPRDTVRALARHDQGAYNTPDAAKARVATMERRRAAKRARVLARA